MELSNETREVYKKVYELKDLLRTGWVKRNVPAKRLESVAEHSFGMSVLATLLESERKYESLNWKRIYAMINVHEWAETIIGDLTPVDNVDSIDKHAMEYAAMKSIMANHVGGSHILELWEEFEVRETSEAKFVYVLDKFHAVLQAKEYSEKYDMPLLLEEFNEHYKQIFDNREDIPEELMLKLEEGVNR